MELVAILSTQKCRMVNNRKKRKNSLKKNKTKPQLLTGLKTTESEDCRRFKMIRIEKSGVKAKIL